MANTNDVFDHAPESVAVETYLTFVNFVITPLKRAIKAGEVEERQVIDTLEQMKSLIRYLERMLDPPEKEPKDFNALHTPSALDPPHDGPPIAHPWISTARQFPQRQRATAREIEILRTLEEAAGSGVSLKRLQHRLIFLGLADEDKLPAIVTHISRLKKDEAVGSEAHGLYSQTPGGANKLKKLQRNYPTLFAPDGARDTIPQAVL